MPRTNIFIQHIHILKQKIKTTTSLTDVKAHLSTDGISGLNLNREEMNTLFSCLSFLCGTSGESSVCFLFKWGKTPALLLEGESSFIFFLLDSLDFSSSVICEDFSLWEFLDLSFSNLDAVFSCFLCLIRVPCGKKKN